MKKLIAMLLAMALVVALTACGSTEATVSNEIPNAPTEEPAAGTSVELGSVVTVTLRHLNLTD